ncbi:hypothetical protein BH23ACI1_BH23ACI1_06290 [soil metagenome]
MSRAVVLGVLLRQGRSTLISRKVHTMRLIVFVLGVLSAALWSLGVHAAGPAALTMEQFLEGRWPSRPAWSPDGRYLSFLWTDWVTQDLYVVAAAGGKPVRLTSDAGFVGGPTWNSGGQYGEWAPDSSMLLHATPAGLTLLPVPSGEARLLPGTAGAGGARFSPDGRLIAFVSGGNIHLYDIAEARTRPLTREGRVSGVTWSPDGRWLATSIGEPATRLTTTPDYVGPFLTFSRSRSFPRDVAIVSVATGSLRRLLPSAEDHESVLAWLPDSSGLLLQRTSLDQKERTIFVYDVASSTERPLYRQRDEKYLATNDQASEISPDGRTLLLTSDQDGWNHLYTIPIAGGTPRQITQGSFEVSFPAWSRDGSRIFFSSSEHGSDQRHLYAVPAAGGQRIRITSEPGVDTTLVVSPADDALAFIRSNPANLPDLWVTAPVDGASAKQLTQSMTPALKAFGWQAPRIISYPAKDGLLIKAQLFLPEPFDPAATYPAIVHVHQAAIYQEAFLGSGPHKDNLGWYGWHQRMAGRGFVILNVDYRGSSGYGRDFRTANHLDVGVGDASDVIQGVEYLKTLGYVDQKRIGVYGMSYGGHMVLTLLSKYPDTFRAGINIAGVFDFELDVGPWAIRNSWMYARLGTPELNPAAYRNASAVNFIENLRAPVLTLQGLADVHVTPLQSFKLIDELLKRGKRFEFAMYPGEVHFFSRRQSWLDAFERMERFFDEWLGGP